jgi:hemerythrin
MRLFKWSAADAVFLPEIDAEHRAIFQAAAELQHAAEGSASKEKLLQILRGVLAQAEDHFTHEERLMQSARYLSFAWHKRQHDTLRKRAKKAMARIAKGDRAAAVEFVEFLGGWVRDHMSVADRMMGAYLRNRNRAAHAA